VSARDPFQDFVDELTALRRSVEHLARSSLDKGEAQDLHASLTEGVARMEAAGATLERALGGRLDRWAKKTGGAAVRASERAAGGEVAKLRPELLAAARDLSQAAGEARREAWRWFGGFWVWLAAMLATGAFLGALAAFWIGGTISARDFGDYPGVFCASAGGQRVTQSSGWTFCAVPIEGPE
jgi:hypothetical protein